MTALYWIFLLFTVSLASQQPQESSRSKRGLLELAGVISCSTGRSPLAYTMYGCYCGLGGQGWPRDEADWCCHKHDCCYGDAELEGCQAKTESYKWTCDDEEVDCDSLNDRCAKINCLCDKETAKCLKEAPFNKKYMLWPDFLCGDEHPTCNIY